MNGTEDNPSIIVAVCTAIFQTFTLLLFCFHYIYVQIMFDKWLTVTLNEVLDSLYKQFTDCS